MMINERIAVNPAVYHGQACIRGTRIPVHQIIKLLANGDTIKNLLQAYPSIAVEDVFACLDYAAELVEKTITPLETIEG